MFLVLINKLTFRFSPIYSYVESDENEEGGDSEAMDSDDSHLVDVMSVQMRAGGSLLSWSFKR